MPRSNPLLWPKPPAIWNYTIAVLSVAAALTISRLPALHLQDAPVSLFLCAVILSAWFGGIWPGLLAMALSSFTFYYFFLPPIYSLGAKPDEIPRLLVFMVSALFVGLLSVAQRSATESLRRARDDLRGTVQELQKTNEALQAESHERMHAESRLRRSEAYLAEAQRLTHTGSFGWSVRSGEMLWSDETFRIFECDSKTKPTLEVVLQRTHPADIAFVKQTIESASQGQKDFDFEHRLLMQDDSIKWLRVVGHAVRDESGEFEYVGALMDITSSKEAEDRTRLIIDTVPAQLWTETPEGVVDFVNRPWVEYTGGTPEEAVGTGWTRMVHPDDIERVLSTRRALIAEGKPREMELRLRRFDGQYRWFLSRGRPLVDRSGRILRWYGSVTDIHDRKEAEEALRRSEGYLSEAQRLTHTGSWAWRVAGRDALHLSEEWYRIYGFDPEEGLSAWEKRLQRMHPEDRAKWQETIDRAISEKSDYEGEHRILLPDGTVKYTHTVGHPVLNASGDVVQFVGIMMDVTERRRAEEERERLRQAHAELAHINRATTMGELTASLAHEVNQPIAAAVTNANTCLRWLAGDTPNIEEARAATMRIVKDGKRAAEIISRIRLLFKKGTSERERVDVNEVIREMIVLLRGEITRYDILVGTDLAADLPQVMADRVQLQQVLMNLMINGIEAMKDADGMRELAITSLRTENERVVVSITDSGVGLPPQQAEQIFNAFFTTKPHGTGMGLRISRSIIESHGGRLWAASNSPHGASFCFTLPSKAEVPE